MRYGVIPFFIIMLLCATLFGENESAGDKKRVVPKTTKKTEKQVLSPQINNLKEMLAYLAKKPNIGYKASDLLNCSQSQRVKTKKYFFEIKGQSLEDDPQHNFCIMGDLTWRIKTSAPKNQYRGRVDILFVSRDTGKLVFRNLKVKLRVLCPT